MLSLLTYAKINLMTADHYDIEQEDDFEKCRSEQTKCMIMRIICIYIYTWLGKNEKRNEYYIVAWQYWSWIGIVIRMDDDEFL